VAAAAVMALLASAPTAQAAGGSLSIPSVGIHTAPMVRVGTRHGQVVVPKDVRRVGWWHGSRPLGATTGSSLLVGHVADGRQRPGALSRLREVRRGARIRVVWRWHATWWRVTRITYTPRTRDLPSRVWRRSGRRLLNVVTCAHRVVYPNGYYHYRDNLTVTAVPVGKPRSARNSHAPEPRADR